MPDVFLDRRLPDYFDEFDVSRTGDAAGVLPSFLKSRMAVLRNTGAQGLDLSFLRSITFPQVWEMKKFQFANFLDDYQANGARAAQYGIVFDACGRDRGRFKALIGQFRTIRQSLEDLLARVLHGATIERPELTARFCETRQENLHFDLDAGSEDHEAFRLYLNVDDAPRIWTTSYQLNDLAHRLAGRIGAETMVGEPVETVLKKLSRRAFGGWHNRADEREAPRHMAYFDPGDVWVMDGRTLAHQVLYGARVISAYVRLPVAANPGLTPSFPDKARRAFDDLRGPKNADGDGVFVHGRVHPAPDIKETWTDVFGKTGSGRLRRFTGQGMV